MSDEKPQAWQRRDHSRDLTGLGWLEADVLRVVWDKGEVTVRDVYEELRENRRIAYTTVMSVLRNLAAKGLLEQDKSAAGVRVPPQGHRRAGRARHPRRARRQDHGRQPRPAHRLPAAPDGRLSGRSRSGRQGRRGTARAGPPRRRRERRRRAAGLARRRPPLSGRPPGASAGTSHLPRAAGRGERAPRRSGARPRRGGRERSRPGRRRGALLARGGRPGRARRLAAPALPARSSWTTACGRRTLLALAAAVPGRELRAAGHVLGALRARKSPAELAALREAAAAVDAVSRGHAGASARGPQRARGGG